jgi:hypothetical protein
MARTADLHRTFIEGRVFMADKLQDNKAMCNEGEGSQGKGGGLRAEGAEKGRNIDIQSLRADTERRNLGQSRESWRFPVVAHEIASLTVG